MPLSLYDSGSEEKKKNKTQTSIVQGTVTNNCDPASQGKVLVRIPSLDQEVWARMSSIGAGSDAGMFYIPRNDDEVLVALCGNEPVDAYILGGLWNTSDSPPVGNPLEVTTKRMIKTGIVAGQGHTIEFDDGVGQSVTITTTTKQKIVLEPKKIEISNLAGTLTITLDNTTQKITLWAANEIAISAGQKISLNSTQISITAVAEAKITGAMVKINS
jgi:uncharacterized protein involved in type VI secretion and phage assembly